MTAKGEVHRVAYHGVFVFVVSSELAVDVQAPMSGNGIDARRIYRETVLCDATQTRYHAATASLSADITDFVQPGENLLDVSVTNALSTVWPCANRGPFTPVRQKSLRAEGL